MNKAWRFFTASLLGGAGAYVAGSWLAGKALGWRLVSPEGLAPLLAEHKILLDALAAGGGRVEELRHPGSSADPVELAAVFASLKPDAAPRPTILFLHGKGGG